MNGNALKIFGFVATVVGAVASMCSSLINAKQQEILIAEKAQEAVANLLSEES